MSWNVCPRCDGEGGYVNPAIDGNGITSDEMHELGEEFEFEYRSGTYDVLCELCGGRRVVDDEELLAWNDMADTRAMEEAERGAGA